MATLHDIHGAGLGLKRELIPQIQSLHGTELLKNIQFLEIAPENWLNIGGKYKESLHWLLAHYPIVCHGLCLSLGGAQALNIPFIRQIKTFLQQHAIPLYTEHLSFCSDDGLLYDLLPIPFTEEAVHYVARRIQQTQDILGQRIGIENTSAYVAAPMATMDELTFLTAILEEADCWLHLDINNIYVNSVNFGFDPHAFLHGIPKERIIYAHIAGHHQETPRLLIDTHGEEVIDPVWDLLKTAYQLFGPFPTLLERDSNIPPLPTLIQEINRIAKMQADYAA